jgi:hypothetical protein
MQGLALVHREVGAVIQEIAAGCGGAQEARAHLALLLTLFDRCEATVRACDRGLAEATGDTSWQVEEALNGRR